MLKISKSRPEKFHLTQNVSQMICYDAKRVENVFLCRVFFTAVIPTAEVWLFSYIAQGAYFGAIWRRQYATYRDNFFTISDNAKPRTSVEYFTFPTLSKLFWRPFEIA